MSQYLKKFLLSSVIILALFFLVFWGINNFKNYVASLSGVITAWVMINPLEVKVSAPEEVEIGKVFKVEARLINKGEEKIENAKGEIFLLPELVLIQKDSVKGIGVIPGKREKRISWQVQGETVGDHIITVSASGELKGEIISAQDSTMVEVKETLPRGRARSLLQNLFDFFQEWFRF